MNRNYNFLPLDLPFYLVLFILLILLLPILSFLYVGGIVGAFAKLGLSPLAGYSLLFLALIGSMINIPVKKISSTGELFSEKEVSFYGIKYRIPIINKKETIVAVNLGGALVPASVSLYELIRLLVMGRIWLFFASIIAIIIVAAVCHRFARPVKGLGIAIPTFIPPIIAALTALILAWYNPSIVAYIGGTMGTLIGADLMNIGRITDLGAPVASIGGAGTFDGIFLTGILAVLLV